MTTDTDGQPLGLGLGDGLGPLLAPRDWQAIAFREAAELAGTPEGKARLVESRRYGALADELDRLRRGECICIKCGLRQVGKLPESEGQDPPFLF